jgi:hypothetical protein
MPCQHEIGEKMGIKSMIEPASMAVAEGTGAEGGRGNVHRYFGHIEW